MTPELWQSISALYSELNELSEAQREARLSELAKSDPELHCELVRLLAATRRDGSGVVDRPALGPSVLSPFFANFPRLHPGELLAGRFEIVSHRGSGGMGEVYEAQDRQLNGRVALKLIRHQVTAQPGSIFGFNRLESLASSRAFLT